MSEQDEVFNNAILKAELIGKPCGIRHFLNEGMMAVTYINQKFRGFRAVIPICQICVNRLEHDDWVLLYCVRCNQSIWIYKPESISPTNYKKGEHIKWLDYCKFCYGLTEEQLIKGER